MMRTLFACLAMVLALLGTAAAAQEDYRIKAGDVLRIEVLEDPSLNRSVLVTPDGRVNLPLAGVLRVAGRPVEAVQADLISRLAGNFATSPTVYVGLERLAEPRAPTGGGAPAATPRGIEVYVMGEAAKPGRLTVEPGTTLLQLFAEMGGFSKFAAVKRIQLRRTENGTETIHTFNYRAIEQGGSGGNTRLKAGDVIVVPQRKLFE
jgi:polysaccharide export outer membrane protein